MEINFTEPYGRLYETIEDGELEIFNFENEHGKVKNMFIKRKIPLDLENKVFFDIVTPYGYGGPVIQETTDEEKLLAGYFEAFSNYCQTNDIITEFIRFDLFENTQVRDNFYGDVMMVGKNIVRDLNLPTTKDIRTNILRNAKTATQNGIKIILDETGEYIDDFLEVYYSTMERTGAEEYYYFDKTFFEQIHETMKDQFIYIHAIKDEKIISTALVLLGNKSSFGFLAGTLRDYYDYHPEAIVQLTTIQWLKDKGLTKYILGGGHKGEDNIYLHKKGYARNGDHLFYVGKKVHDPIIYEKLIDLRKTFGNFDIETSFFPKYRT
ncbi:GNAT family N-acetyltransferase [Carnobacterium sp. ISL-102]|uniref:GNAT family N-acetyltransferase n=1 Tax=Carnobacterium sp. ISL-102 TaxID=2819142 RepID=UPI001BE8696F|nr:GNAT family N-acetyltransferase [Carnobacterium sp. ISL-102]MBT2731008.1 GNAT family N-acetyltransferase [Carnobacterium sp. ISL-102]